MRHLYRAGWARSRHAKARPLFYVAEARRVMIWALLACSTPHVAPLPAGKAPDVLLVYMPSAAPSAVSGGTTGYSAAISPVLARHALLTGTWTSASASAVWEIAALYGWKYEKFAQPCVQDGLTEWLTWRLKQGAESVFSVVEGSICGSLSIADLTKTLAPSKVLDRTLMVFVAAQGEGSDENALRSVPMWISDPKKRPIGPEPWSTLDVVPTILSTLNATIPSDAAGRDLFAATAPQPVVTLGEAGAWVVNGDYTLTIADINQPEAVILQDETRTNVYDKDAQEAMVRFAQVVWSQAHGGRTGEEKLKDVLQSRGYWP